MLKRLLLLSLSAALLSSCATTDGPEIKPAPEVKIVTQTKIVDTGCDWTRPIFVSKGDVLTDDTAKAILAHNLAGVKNCNWKPNR
jgi:type IV pilus biogenesis protein CpaD/CtpE